MAVIEALDERDKRPIVNGSIDEWGTLLNSLYGLTEDKINEVIENLNTLLSISSVFQIKAYPTKADFPTTGLVNIIYYAIDIGVRYMWDGMYISLSTGDSSVSSVNGEVGDVVLDKSDIGLNNADNTSDITKATTVNYGGLNTSDKTIVGAINEIDSETNIHYTDYSNPHKVTKTQVGLSNVDNTSDLNKPISITTQTALNLKADKSSPTFTGTITTPIINVTDSIAVTNAIVSTSNSFDILRGVDSINIGDSSSNINVKGNLIVEGTTTTINSTITTIKDPVLTLGEGTVVDDNKDRGIEFKWNNGTDNKIGFFGFDDSTGKFTFIPDATNTSEVFTGTAGTFVASIFEGDLTGKFTTARTIGTLTGDIISAGSSFDGSANNTNSTTISSNVVDNSKLAQMGAYTIKANNTNGLANSQDVSVEDMQGMLDIKNMAIKYALVMG